MDQIKIGRFIAERRRLAGLTQMQLAERLSITDRAVSKWENGRAMPDTGIMIPLCEALGISVNDLLCGEVITMENYNKKNEELLLDMARQKQESDRQLLALEILIGAFSVIILLGFTVIAAYLEMEAWLRALLIVSGIVIGMIGFSFALKIEQTAGYYECGHCHHKYVPKYGAVYMAMHMGRTRYMKCPECGKYSWQKKKLTKE